MLDTIALPCLKTLRTCELLLVPSASIHARVNAVAAAVQQDLQRIGHQVEAGAGAGTDVLL